MRYVLDIAYHGKAYHGWQSQPNAHTIQAELEQALETIFQQKCPTIASGRTDTGVHAKQQYVQFDLNRKLDPSKEIHSLNGVLPGDISINHVYSAREEFSTRFDANLRQYVYRIVTQKNPLEKGLAAGIYYPLNLELMNRGAKILLEYEDFESFSKVHTDVNHFRCHLKSALWESTGDLLEFRISANRFLRNMVRSIVGTLLQIGSGKFEPEQMRSIIEAKDRKKAGFSAPAEGLYLEKVIYPDGLLSQII